MFDIAIKRSNNLSDQFRFMKSLRLFLTILSLLAISMNARANHLLGGEINYRLVSSSGNAAIYRVTLSFFADCSSNIPGAAFQALVNATPEVTLYKGNNLSSRKKLQYNPLLSDKEITPACPDELSNTACSNITNPIPGVKLYVYNADFTVIGKNENWRFAFEGNITFAPALTTIAGRSLIIQNAFIVDPNSGTATIMYLEATLNNTTGENNSTAFLSPPTPFFCINKPAEYSLAAVDADQDSLSFTLIPARAVLNNAGQYTNVDYVPPYTALNPLPTIPGNFNFNNINGQLSFTPNLVLNCLVTNLVEEYRNGVRIGSSMREMTFVILDNCNNDAPNSPVSNIENANIISSGEGNLMLSVCEGQVKNITFDIQATDPDNDNVTVSYANLPAGATITIDNNGTPTPVIHFLWNLIDAPPGNHIFYITYSDDGCPLSTRKTVAYTLTVIPHQTVFATGWLDACPEKADGKAWAVPDITIVTDYNYKWLDSDGSVLRNVQSTTGDTLLNLPPGKYKLYIRNADGCGKNIEYSVGEQSLPAVQLQADTVVCQGLPIHLSIASEPDIRYMWNTGDTTCCIIVTEKGDYVLTAENKCGFSKDSVFIDFVKCNYCLFVPNAFTPNGDGSNDVFNIVPTCLINKYIIKIFNRWGQLVFTSLNIGKSWDGTYKGHEAEVGTYFYVIDVELEDKSKGNLQLKGDITLIR